MKKILALLIAVLLTTGVASAVEIPFSITVGATLSSIKEVLFGESYQNLNVCRDFLSSENYGFWCTVWMSEASSVVNNTNFKLWIEHATVPSIAEVVPSPVLFENGVAQRVNISYFKPLRYKVCANTDYIGQIAGNIEVLCQANVTIAVNDTLGG